MKCVAPTELRQKTDINLQTYRSYGALLVKIKMNYKDCAPTEL